jgi:DNA-binding IscR family transcriptional regulator
VKTCTVRLVMTKVRDAMSDVLDRVTVADMVAMGEGRRRSKRAGMRRVVTSRSHGGSSS